VSFEVALHNVDAALPELAFKSELPRLPFECWGAFNHVDAGVASVHGRATSL
jgi:hypothetical protein